jgi:hypothetical protein
MLTVVTSSALQQTENMFQRHLISMSSVANMASSDAAALVPPSRWHTDKWKPSRSTEGSLYVDILQIDSFPKTRY